MNKKCNKFFKKLIKNKETKFGKPEEGRLYLHSIRHFDTNI